MDKALSSPQRFPFYRSDIKSLLSRVPIWMDIVLILSAAIAVRWAYFGNPAIGSEEQFYLLVGDRMLRGEIPVIDIWDRLPPGLFLIYAASRLLGGNGILEYQSVAALFVMVASVVLYAWGRALQGRTAGITAALSYVIGLNVVQGGGGASPVFYNTLVIAAAWLVFRAGDCVNGGQAPNFRSLLLTGSRVMILLGLALQIKYTVVVEGVFLGLVLLWLVWRQKEDSFYRVLGATVLWVGLALLPTALALLFYTTKGALAEFIYADFLSIGHKHLTSLSDAWPRARDALKTLALLGVPALGFLLVELARLPQKNKKQRWRTRFLFGWLLCAIIGLGIIGGYYRYYFLTLIAPLSLLFGLLAATLFHCFRGMMFFIPAFLLAKAALGYRHELHIRHSYGDGNSVYGMARVIEPYLQKGCLFVYDGPSILYHLTHSCLLSRYVYPSHFNNADEAQALGGNIAHEMALVLAQSPTVIVTTQRRDGPTLFRHNQETQALLDRALIQNYRLIGRFPYGARATILIFARSSAP